MSFQRGYADVFLGILAGGLFLAHGHAIEVLCGQYQNVTADSGEYTISANQWGKDDSGSQCLYVNTTDTPSFSAIWSWTANATDVHSFPNVNLNDPLLPIELSNLSALVVSVDWLMYPQFSAETSSATKFDTKALGNIDTKANVALDMFMDSDPKKAVTTTTPSHELMIWFGTVGEILPIGYDAGPVGSHNLHGSKFKLYRGANANFQTVYSWVPSTNITKLDDKDVTQLVHFLWVHDFIENSMYLGIVQLGTETVHSNGENVTFVANDVQISMEKGTPKASWNGSIGRDGDRMAMWSLFLVSGLVVLAGSGFW